MNTLTHLIGTLRQLLQPAEFRIPTPAWPADWEASLRQLSTAATEAPATQADMDFAKQQRQEHERQKMLTDMATSLWRLRTRMLDPGTTSPKETYRRDYRHVEALWDALAATGVEVQDPTGIPFDVGMSLKVLAYQPTPGVTKERVQETHKPSVLLHGKLIQMGEVYVATPEKATGLVPTAKPLAEAAAEPPSDPSDPSDSPSDTEEPNVQRPPQA